VFLHNLLIALYRLKIKWVYKKLLRIKRAQQAVKNGFTKSCLNIQKLQYTRQLDVAHLLILIKVKSKNKGNPTAGLGGL
jgi:hypothetical protein